MAKAKKNQNQKQEKKKKKKDSGTKGFSASLQNTTQSTPPPPCIIPMSYMNPARINRGIVSNTNRTLAENILNYYVYTSICYPVNSIDTPSYSNFRTRFMDGGFRVEKDKEEPAPPEVGKVIHYLKVSRLPDMEFMFDGVPYEVTDEEVTAKLEEIAKQSKDILFKHCEVALELGKALGKMKS